MALPDQQINTGLYVETTEIFDVISQLQQTEVNTPEFKELIVRLARHVNRVNLSLNLKESGMYFLEEFITGQLWNNSLASNPNNTDELVFSPDNQTQAFRKVLFTTSDPHTNPAEAPVLPAGITNVPHGLSPQVSTSSGGATPSTNYSGWQFTNIYGVATNTISRLYYPLNFSGPTYISAFVNSTNIVIDNQSGVTFDKVRIVLEYVKF